MPPTSRQPEEDEDDELSEPGLDTLQFNETLSWRPGKPIAVGVLVSRLEKLSKELEELDQETTDKDSLTNVAKELVSHGLLAHKDRGVKALTAACLVDVLRICAPDAPFTETQLKDIFTLFITHIMTALHDVTASYHTQHKYVLSSLAEVKSVLLLNEIHQPEELLLHLFSTLFDTVSSTAKASSGEQVSTDVVYHATEILSCLVEESPNLPAPVVDVIMAQFLRAAPSGGKRDKVETDSTQATLSLKEIPPAYSMAKSICDQCPDKMARSVSQYFGDVIYDAGSKSNGHRAHADGEDDDAVGPSDDDLKELRKAHQLLRELWRASPRVLLNIIPQLDAELNADNVHVRQLATETLGDIIAGIGAAGPPPPPTLDPLAYPPLKMTDEVQVPTLNILTKPSSPQAFAQTHPSAYRNFVSRRNDKSPTIRAAWTTAAGFILSTRAGGTGLTSHDQNELVKFLGDKLTDSDEKVRLAAVKAIESFSFQDLITILAPSGGVDKKDSVLGSLADRCRDKRPALRVDANIFLAKLWAVGAGEIAAGDEAVTAALSGVPSRIWNSYYANDKELNVLLDRVIFECLIPLGYPPSPPKSKNAKQANGSGASSGSFDQDRVRAERMMLLVRSLDVNAKKSFYALHARQPQFSKILLTFVAHCDAFNGGVMDDNAARKTDNLKKTIKYISQFLPDEEKATTDLHRFAKVHDRRNYQLIKFAVAIESDFKTAHRAIKELAKRVQGSNYPGMLETLIPLLYRSSCLLFNRSYLSTFMDHSRNPNDEFGATSLEILNEISTRNPELFKTHIGVLCKDLAEHAPSENGVTNPAVVESLRACSSYCRKYPDETPSERPFIQTLMKHALYGPVKGTKFAVNILMAKNDENSKVYATELLRKIMKDWSYESEHFLNKLAVVCQVQLLAPLVTADWDDDILEMAIQKLLLQTHTEIADADPDWLDVSDNKELHAKCLALKIVVNRLLSTPNEDEAKERAPPVFKLLRNILNKGGEIAKGKNTPQYMNARLRLAAAQSYLKLAAKPVFDDLLSPAEFNTLAYVVQDAQPTVRRCLIEKLQKYLVQGRLKSRYYTILFLTAYEPNAQLKQSIETWIRSRVRHFDLQNQKVMESVMGRLISLLAHHPDFGSEPDELLDHAKYLVFYVRLVASEANLGLIFKYAERVKQTRDAIDADRSENLYITCDLAMAVIRKWQEKKNWAFQAYPNKLGIPKGLYSALPSHSVAQEIAEKQYIPEGLEDRIEQLLSQASKKRKYVYDAETGHPAKKVKSLASRKAKAEKSQKTPKTKTPARKKVSKLSSSADGAALSTAERRRSGRAVHIKQSYADRDDDEDEEEMLEGVAQWTYEDEDESGSGSEDESEGGDSDSSNGEDKEDSKSRSELSDAPESDKDEDGDEEMKDVAEEGEEPMPIRKGRKGATSSSSTKAPAQSTAKKQARLQKPSASKRKATVDEDSGSELPDAPEPEVTDAIDKDDDQVEPKPTRRSRATTKPAAKKSKSSGPTGKEKSNKKAKEGGESDLSNASDGEDVESGDEEKGASPLPSKKSKTTAPAKGKKDKPETQDIPVRTGGRRTRNSAR